jgi:hypothetical protein
MTGGLVPLLIPVGNAALTLTSYIALSNIKMFYNNKIEYVIKICDVPVCLVNNAFVLKI